MSFLSPVPEFLEQDVEPSSQVSAPLDLRLFSCLRMLRQRNVKFPLLDQVGAGNKVKLLPRKVFPKAKLRLLSCY